MLENSLAQLQEKVTRPISNSVLDLLVTTNPNLVDSVPEVFPGMSDHCLVTFDINMKPKLRKKTQRKIFMYHKANLSTLKQDTLNFASDFLNSNLLSRSVNANWETIRDKVTDLANKHVPSKLSKTKHNLPWVNVDVKRKCERETGYSPRQGEVIAHMTGKSIAVIVIMSQKLCVTPIIVTLTQSLDHS